MRLITEVNEELRVLEEADTSGKKSLFIEGIFLQSAIKNRNGRVYPTEILENEVKRYTESYINKNRAYGELGHPNGPTINLDRVSHVIKSLRREGNDFIGKAKIMDTPMGNIVKNLMNEGCVLGVSSRGMGSIKSRNGLMEVQNDFYLATAADIVSDPSAPSAFVNGIMEGVEWVWDNGILQHRNLEMAREEINRASRSVDKKALEESQLRVWNRLINQF